MQKSSPYTKGFITFIVLMVLTIVEYYIGLASNPSAVLLILIAILKGGLIMNIFMNIGRLWRPEEHH
ncbi:MAG: cytochrome C oxidase subunit IV family protein [Chloroflexi bacterium]|nr:cytochrome C oxidase subunit IV family protein [Chloroflexota bacterium]MDA0242911.1 cytochrome C oxidase subunit IV family protein [Chloroflexota bacterium]